MIGATIEAKKQLIIEEYGCYGAGQVIYRAANPHGRRDSEVCKDVKCRLPVSLSESIINEICGCYCSCRSDDELSSFCASDSKSKRYANQCRSVAEELPGYRYGRRVVRNRAGFRHRRTFGKSRSFECLCRNGKERKTFGFASNYQYDHRGEAARRSSVLLENGRYDLRASR